MRRMNYNPFETPFASGELQNLGGSSLNDFKFVLDNPLEKGIYLVTIVVNDLPDRLDEYVYTGIFKLYNGKSSSSEFNGDVGDFQITFLGDFTIPESDLKLLTVTLLNNYEVDLSSFSYIINLYKIA